MGEVTEQQPTTTGTGEARASEPPAAPQQAPAMPEQRPGVMARTRRFFKKPGVGGTMAGAITLGVAATVGVLEAAVAGGVAYGVYAILRKRKREE